MAVYTHLTHEDIAAFLLHYPVGVLLAAEGIAEGISNSNYLLEISPLPLRQGVRGWGTLSDDAPARKRADKKKYILTVFESRTRTEELPYFMGLTAWLADRGIPAPRPVTGRGGASVHWIKGKPAALVQFLEGRNNPAIVPAHLALVGTLAARMHEAAEGFPMIRRNALSLWDWKNMFIALRNRADDICPGLERLIADELNFLHAHWPQSLPSGPIHADLFPDNIFFNQSAGGELKISGVIDFYYACHDFWAYDLAIAMNAWCFDEAWHFIPERAEALLSSYHSRRPLTTSERLAMPVLVRGAALRFLLTRATAWLAKSEGALVTPKNPMEYVAKLRHHQGNNSLAPFIGGEG